MGDTYTQTDIDNALIAHPTLKDTSVEFDTITSSFKIVGLENVDATISIKRDPTDSSVNLDRLFGKDSVSLNTTAASGDMKQLTAAQNAIVSINGIEIERSSNNFDYNGLSFIITSETSKDKLKEVIDPITNEVTYKNDDAPTQVVVTRDSQKILDGIKEFVEEYNKLVTSLYELYNADATYKDYAPLTTAQKADMSDREIEQWEEKSKEGLLKSDESLYKIMSTMRQAIYSKPEGSSLSIYNMGIGKSTGFYVSDGTLSIASDADILAAIEKDPEGVQNLFSGTGGIMDNLNTAINEAIRSQNGESGYMIRVAGANDLDTTSSLYKQIKQIDDQMISLESRYWNEYDRYWSQFNKMEQLIQQMNTQSSWMSQMMGS